MPLGWWTGGRHITENRYTMSLLRALLSMVAIAAAACGAPPSAGTGAPAGTRDGSWVFRTSGCATCHESASALEACRDGDEPPPRELLAYDVAAAYQVAERRRRDGEPGMCRAVADFSRRWQRYRAHIRNGSDTMPPWERREHRDRTVDTDIDRVLSELVVQHVPAGSARSLERVLDEAQHCAEPVPRPPMANEAVLELLARDLRAFEVAPSVELESMESGLADLDDNVVVNQVSRQQVEGLEVWFLRQRLIGRGSSPASRFAIAIDRGLAAPRAYFAAFDEQGVPALEGAECFECHASGPRALRPQRPAQIAPLSDGAWRQIREWNRDIAAQGAIEIELPESDRTQAERLAVRPLDVAGCSRCHSAGSAVRTPLSGYHLRPIMMMMRAHAREDGYVEPRSGCVPGLMPHGPALPGDEEEQIERWIADGCRAGAEPGPEMCKRYLGEADSR